MAPAKESRRRKVLASLLAVGLLGGLAAFGIFGAFSATTQNDGNNFTAGNVAISDNDGGSTPLYLVSNARPGESNPANEACIKVDYTGSLESNVKLYRQFGTEGGLAQYVNLVVTEGTDPSPSFKDCDSFVPGNTGTGDDGVIFDGPLNTFPADRASGLTGSPDGSRALSAWRRDTSAVYRFQVTLDAGAPAGAQGASTDPHNFVWDAQNN